MQIKYNLYCGGSLDRGSSMRKIQARSSFGVLAWIAASLVAPSS